MNKIPLSVFIVSQDEEKNIARVLSSVNFADEIILVDSGSQDKTLSIAETFNVTIIKQPWLGYAKQKQFAMEQCRNDWVLNLDADEAVSHELKKEIVKTVQSNNCDSLRCLRDDIFIGRKLSNWTKKPNNLRLYKKSQASFDDSRMVHESADINGSEKSVDATLIHYGYGNIRTLTEKINQYSSLKAEEKYSKNKSYSTIKLVLIFPLVFIQEWLFKRKIFSGRRGFILSVIQAYYAFMKEAKLYEQTEMKNIGQSTAQTKKDLN